MFIDTHDGYGNVTQTTQSGWDGDATTQRIAETVYDNGRYVSETKAHIDGNVQTTSRVIESSRNKYGVPTEVRDLNDVWSKTIKGVGDKRH